MKKISALLLVLLVIISSTFAAYADDLHVDANLHLSSTQTYYDFGEVEPGAYISNNVEIWATGSGKDYPVTVGFNGNGSVLSANGVTIYETRAKYTDTVSGIAPTTAGNYSYTVTWSTNFPQGGFRAVSVTYSLTVAPQQVNPSVTWPTASITYGEELTDSSLVGGSATYGDVSVAGTFTLDNPPDSLLEAGSHSYATTFTPDDLTSYNVVNGISNVTVAKAIADINVEGVEVTYDGNAHGAIGTATGVNEVDLSYLLNFGDSFTNAPGGTANWTFEGNNNYTATNGSVEIVINKADATIVVEDITVTYDGNLHEGTGTATGVNDVELEGLDFSEGFINAPGGTVNWSFNGGTNYNDDSGSVEIVINKATPTVIAWPTASMTQGQTLANAGVTGGEASVEGTFAFSNPTTVPNSGNQQEFEGIFTPTDTTNYNTVTGNILVNVSVVQQPSQPWQPSPSPPVQPVQPQQPTEDITEDEIFILEEDEIPQGSIETTPEPKEEPNLGDSEGAIAADEVEVQQDEKEYIILDEEIPLGATELPKTGERNPMMFTFLGLLISSLGIKMKKRYN